MKKLLTLITLLAAGLGYSQCNWTVTAYAANGNSITCATPTVQLKAFDNYSTGITYNWSGPGTNINSAFASVTQVGTYTVTAIHAPTSCTITQTVSIGINTTVPTSSVTPFTTSVICNNPANFTATAISPTVNIEHKWRAPLTPFPSQDKPWSYFSTNQQGVLESYVGAGTYTHVLTDLTNGCTTTQTVSVTSSMAYPAFGLLSPTNFNIGCAPLNQATISIINPVSTQTPPSTCSFSFVPPTYTGAIAPGILDPNNSSTVTNIPGVWRVIVRDNANSCRSEFQILVTQNTVAPNVSAHMLTNTLTCYTPTVLAKGWTYSNNTSLVWNVPMTPPMVASSTLLIGDPTWGPIPTTVSPVYANYTVVATNSLNACTSTSVITIYQNFKPPVSNPVIVGTPTYICNGMPVTLSTGNSSVTSGVPGASVIVESWSGPVPQATSAATSYSAYVGGTYSLLVRDSYNGCLRTGTIQVTDGGPSFSLQGAAPSTSVSCNGSASIIPVSDPGYSISVNTGILTGTTVTGLCYGKLKVCLTYTATGCTTCDSLDISAVTALQELSHEKDFSIYPNPAGAAFYIQPHGQQKNIIRIFSSDGKEVETINPPEGSVTEVRGLASGIYFVEVSGNNYTVRKKVVVMH